MARCATPDVGHSTQDHSVIMVLARCTYFFICFRAKHRLRISLKKFHQSSQSPAFSRTKGTLQPVHPTSIFILANFGEAQFKCPPNGFSATRDMPPVVSPPVARDGESRRSRELGSWCHGPAVFSGESIKLFLKVVSSIWSEKFWTLTKEDQMNNKLVFRSQVHFRVLLKAKWRK
jgi:hypothetical protein